MKKYISASILAADFAKLGEEVNAVINAGVDWIHFDVMDHHFVPNLSFGAVVCESLRKAGIQAPIDVHLMVENPEKYIPAFAKAGATLIAFHPETVSDVSKTIQLIHDHQLKAGVVFNPETPLTILPTLANQIEMALIMSVHPGFAGQSFIPDSVEKIKTARSILNQAKSHALLAIDGGINTKTLQSVSHAGADFFVVGSGLFSADHYPERVAELKSQLIDYK